RIRRRGRLARVALCAKTVTIPPPERRSEVSAFIITRIQVGDYDAWRPMFDQDRPLAREKATVARVFRKADDPNHVFIFLEFASLTDAEEAARRLVESGVLNRFSDKHGPNVDVEAPTTSS